MWSYLNQRSWSQCIAHRRVEGVRESGLNGLVGSLGIFPIIHFPDVHTVTIKTR